MAESDLYCSDKVSSVVLAVHRRCVRSVRRRSRTRKVIENISLHRTPTTKTKKLLKQIRSFIFLIEVKNWDVWCAMCHLILSMQIQYNSTSKIANSPEDCTWVDKYQPYHTPAPNFLSTLVFSYILHLRTHWCVHCWRLYTKRSFQSKLWCFWVYDWFYLNPGVPILLPKVNPSSWNIDPFGELRPSGINAGVWSLHRNRISFKRNFTYMLFYSGLFFIIHQSPNIKLLQLK